jgi:mono/diheme cytochrome c family protein
MPRHPLAALFALIIPALGAAAQTAPAPEPATEGETAAPAQTLEALLSRFSGDPDRFTQTEGKSLYDATCLACHMIDARGAMGAGAYPPLTGNPKLASKHFLAGVILIGYHGMPGFADKMTDEQVAEVTNYIRSHFGNAYTDPITPAQVAALRPPGEKE